MILQETARSPSPNSSDNESSQKQSGIVRSRLQTTEARSHFTPMRVDASNADFSDRLDGGKGFYKTSKRHRRRRRQWDGEDDGFYGDLSDEDEESVDRRLARLRQELEEVKMELAENSAGTDGEISTDKKEETETDDDTLANVSKLSQALDAVYVGRYGERKGAEIDLAKTIAKFDAVSTITNEQNGQPPSGTAPKHPTSAADLRQALSKAAEFDGRLTFLEHSLGLNGMNIPEQGPSSPKPILHTLENLDRQVQTVLNSAASIDAAQSKTRQLMKEAERLQKLKEARAEQNTSSPPPSAGLISNGQDTAYADDPERVSKINALYGTLSTIDSLAPTLPMVLDRLRALRLLHTSAAAASSTLDELEKRQSNQAEEIKQWREALVQVEQNLKTGEGGLKENVKTVGEWVKDLESRMTKLV
jgi:nuclear migration protein JNM1